MSASVRCVLTLSAALSLTLVAAAQSGRPLSLNDVLTAVRVGDAQLAPDGRTVLYQRTTTDLAKNRRHTDIWSVPAAGGTPKALLSSDKNDTTARWSPDGTKIAFVSTREAGSQVWIANAVAGGVGLINGGSVTLVCPLRTVMSWGSPLIRTISGENCHREVIGGL